MNISQNIIKYYNKIFLVCNGKFYLFVDIKIIIQTSRISNFYGYIMDEIVKP